MAERRMFAKTIVLSDDFLDMPLGARALYMAMGMLADDDGFVNNTRTILRMTGTTEDDLNILINKRFLIAFEDGVTVIKHWRINNFLRNDRHQDTKYTEHFNLLEVDKNNAYTEKKLGIPNNGIPNNGIPSNGIPNMGIPSIDKNSIDKNSIDKISVSKLSEDNSSGVDNVENVDNSEEDDDDIDLSKYRGPIRVYME